MLLGFALETCPPVGDLLIPIQKEIRENLSFVTKRNAGLEKVDNYGMEFEDVGIISICISQELIDVGWFKERVLAKRKAKEADIRLRMNYDKFISSPPEIQRLMYIENIVRSIRALQKKSKGDFRGEELIKDILEALDVMENDLEEFKEEKNK
jgi:hypothetical protein